MLAERGQRLVHPRLDVGEGGRREQRFGRAVLGVDGAPAFPLTQLRVIEHLVQSLELRRRHSRRGEKHVELGCGEGSIGVQNDRGLARGWLVTDVLSADPQLADDPRFANQRWSACCISAIILLWKSHLSLFTRTKHYTAAELDALFAAAGVPAAQIKTLDQVLDHPQLRQRDRWRTVGTEHGPTEAPLPPPHSVTWKHAWATCPHSANTPRHCSPNPVGLGAVDDVLRAASPVKPSSSSRRRVDERT